jgi:hypothetical protein
MREVRVVSIDDLTRRLEAILGADSLLLERLQRGLANRDDRLTEIAMASLEAYPPTVRAAVEQALIAWLFGLEEGTDGSPRPVARH